LRFPGAGVQWPLREQHSVKKLESLPGRAPVPKKPGRALTAPRAQREAPALGCAGAGHWCGPDRQAGMRLSVLIHGKDRI